MKQRLSRPDMFPTMGGGNVKPSFGSQLARLLERAPHAGGPGARGPSTRQELLKKAEELEETAKFLRQLAETMPANHGEPTQPSPTSVTVAEIGPPAPRSREGQVRELLAYWNTNPKPEEIDSWASEHGWVMVSHPHLPGGWIFWLASEINGKDKEHDTIDALMLAKLGADYIYLHKYFGTNRGQGQHVTSVIEPAILYLYIKDLGDLRSEHRGKFAVPGELLGSVTHHGTVTIGN